MDRKNLLKIIVLLAFLHHFSDVNSQQLPQFSQYVFNGIHINPGYAGYKNEGYIQSTYRSQWAKFPGAPKTMSFTADFSAKEGKMGLGVTYVNDKIGLTESNTGLLTYAYRINMSDRGRLSLGISAGIAQNIFDPSSIITVDPDDAYIPENRVSHIFPKLNTGLYYHNDIFFAGLAVYNLMGNRSDKLTEETLSTSFNNAHYYFTMGGMVNINDYIQLKPSILVRHVKGSPSNYDLNAMVLLLEKVWIGGSYRSNMRVLKDQLQNDLSKRNALALVMELSVASNVRLGYAYDHNLNVLSNFRSQSHELSIGFYLKGKKEIVHNPRWF